MDTSDEKREELGRLSLDELSCANAEAQPDERKPSDMWIETPYSKEFDERYQAWKRGAPGVHPMLSRAQVVAVLGPMLAEIANNPQRSDEQGPLPGFWHGYYLGIHACARALLALDANAPSPLEGE